MITRILVAVDDTADSMAAARVSADLAAQLGAQLCAVHVSTNHDVDAALASAASGTHPGAPARPEVPDAGYRAGPGTGTDVPDRRQRAQAAVLARLTTLAGERGIVPETLLIRGTPGPAILQVARDWSADLVVVGRAGRVARGEPYVGSQTRHVLEFCDRPVLVVPPPPAAATGR